MPFLIDSYTFSPVPWKGKDPLRRIKRITPETDNAIISLHYMNTKIATNHNNLIGVLWKLTSQIPLL